MMAGTIPHAKRAVQTFWTHRDCLPDSDSVAEAVEFIDDIRRLAKRQDRRISNHEWLSMAGLVDDTCTEIDMPRLFDIN